MNVLNDTKALGIALGLAVGGYLIYKIVKAGPGLLSGNNALTQTAKNADGTPQTAYQGQGVVGTVGAAANQASGGYLSTFGDWIGQKVGDATIPDANQQSQAATDASVAASTAAWQQPVAAQDQSIDYGTGTGW